MRRYNWMRGPGTVLVLVAFGIGFQSAATGQSQPAVAPGSAPMPSPKKQETAQDQTFTLVGAGDIASCKAIEGAEATAKLIEQIPGTVFAAGDLAYEDGSAAEFRDCYGSTWGRFKNRTR